MVTDRGCPSPGWLAGGGPTLRREAGAGLVDAPRPSTMGLASGGTHCVQRGVERARGGNGVGSRGPSTLSEGHLRGAQRAGPLAQAE